YGPAADRAPGRRPDGNVRAAAGGADCAGLPAPRSARGLAWLTPPQPIAIRRRLRAEISERSWVDHPYGGQSRILREIRRQPTLFTSRRTPSGPATAPSGTRPANRPLQHLAQPLTNTCQNPEQCSAGRT